jgi:hypothetical protein
MSTKRHEFDAVRRIGLSLPAVQEGTAYGTPALRIGGKLLCCIASHKSAEPNTLVVRVPFDRRDEMIETEPDVYYLKDHYVGYPCVLVRLGKVPEDALKDLLLMAHRFVTARARRPGRTGRGKTPTARVRQKR